MAGTARKWFIGCGIGCGLMLLVAGGVGTGGYFMIRKAMDKGKEIESTVEDLQAAYGRPGEFVPNPSGEISAERVETFRDIREAMEPIREEAGGVLRTLHNAEEGLGDDSTLDKVRAGFQLGPSLMGFISQRNQTLLDHGMGLGEYLYIYSLTYFVMLERDPADGPAFTLRDDDDDQDSGGFQIRTNQGGNNDFNRQDRAEEVRDYLHGLQMKMVRAQLEALPREPEHDTWRQTLQAEIALMEVEPYRLLWEEGLPLPLQNSLRPYGDELAALYDEMTNILDCGLVESD